jgi:hypothetical protein
MKGMIPITAIIITTLILALGYALISLWPGVIVIAILGLVWLVGQQRRVGWLHDFGFALFVVVAAVGVWWGAPAGWMLAGTVATVATWDLARFDRRLAQVEQITGEGRLRRDHLRRLLAAAGLGLGFGALALSLQFELSMGWVILLGLLVVVGLSRIVQVARR